VVFIKTDKREEKADKSVLNYFLLY